MSHVRLQRVLIAAAGAANKGTAILMGTAMAVLIGRRGSPFAVSMVFTTFWFGLMVFSPVWGAIADVTGRRRAVLVLTGVLSTVAILPLAVVSGVWLPIFFRGLFAVFAAGFFPVMLTIVSERGGAEARGQSIGFLTAARAVGLMAGQFLAGLLLGVAPPAVLFLVVAGIAAIVVVTVPFVEDPAPSPAEPPTFARVRAEIRARLLPTDPERGLPRTNGLRWLFVAILLRNLTVLGIGSLLPIYLVAEIGVSEYLMGILLAINPAAQMGFMYLLGRVADATGRKPLIVVGVASSGLHGLVMAAALLPATVTVRAVVAGIGFLVLAAGFSALVIGSVAFIGDVAPADRESELMGLRETFRGLGGVVGPAAFGIAATVAGYQATFVTGSLLAFVGTGLVLRFLVESHGRPDGRGSEPA